MKLKLIALAAMLAASASSQAAMDGAGSGNGSLIATFIFQGGSSATLGGDDMSATFDLGVSMNEALSWNGKAGFKRTWNLSTGELTGAGAGIAPTVPQTIGNYGSAFADLKEFAGANVNLIQFSVIALDNTNKGTPLTGSRYLSTGDTSFASTSNGNLTAFENMNAYVLANNALGTHASESNGASTATPTSAANSYFRAINGFGTGDSWLNQTGEDTTKAVTVAQQFWLLTEVAGNASTAVARTPFGYDLGDAGTLVNRAEEFGTWSVDVSKNTITFMTPVPEAETWAMMVAGLGLMGFMARRRKNNAA